MEDFHPKTIFAIYVTSLVTGFNSVLNLRHYLIITNITVTKTAAET
jgi:hypothetical protein